MLTQARPWLKPHAKLQLHTKEVAIAALVVNAVNFPRAVPDVERRYGYARSTLCLLCLLLFSIEFYCEALCDLVCEICNIKRFYLHCVHLHIVHLLRNWHLKNKKQ